MSKPVQEEARRNVACLRNWIEDGRLASCDPEHLTQHFAL
ncbi:TetR family transcriptional regulator C-terminal domain-containing protein [Pseudomonas putida]|nr:TetR family transcriptional regulator C-terminal domain-containing protein [Pseudomonas putida]